ncbi:hypothetical protein AAG747_15450 [Rapidithrix thailandica]|uniref:Uncharacterized protein n=1 Tax=Rapidithrix thailandica TaxID=413964 RepID=A0AAW9SAH8_9BACT
MKTIELGGEERAVAFDMNAMAFFEEATDQGVLDYLSTISKNTGRLGPFRHLVYAMLKAGAFVAKKEFDYSLEEVSSWYSLNDMERIMTVVHANSPQENGKKKPAQRRVAPKAT